MRPGAALNPSTPLSAIECVLDDIDRFCVQGDESARRLVQLGARVHF